MRARKKLTIDERKALLDDISNHQRLISEERRAEARKIGIKVMMYKYNVSHTTIHNLRVANK